MRRYLIAFLLTASVGSAQYFEGDVVREFGVKTGLVRVKYDSIDGSKPDRILDEFLSVYGYLGSQTTAGFNVGVSVELSTGNKMNTDRTVLYSSLELNPSVEFAFGNRFKAYTGFGGSINGFKERAGGRINRDTNFGLQFFVGAKLNIVSNFGLLGEYKSKIFMIGDYESNVVHHFNIGVYFLIH